MRTEEVEFLQDDGYLLGATLYCSSERTPKVSIVFCHGFNGTRGHLAPEIAGGLVDRLDANVLVFDYSGFGTSEGPRGRLDPNRQVRDVQSAVSWMLATFPSTASHLGLYGTSFGASISTVAAAVDDRVGALVAVAPFSSGRLWMRDLRPYWQWVEFLRAIEEDRLARVAPGSTSREISPDWLIPRDPEGTAMAAAHARDIPGRAISFDMLTAELITKFEPGSYANRLRGKPTLYMHCTCDILIGVHHARELASLAEAELVTFDGIGHQDVYEGEPLNGILDLAASWFGRHLVDSSST